MLQLVCRGVNKVVRKVGGDKIWRGAGIIRKGKKKRKEKRKKKKPKGKVNTSDF